MTDVRLGPRTADHAVFLDGARLWRAGVVGAVLCVPAVAGTDAVGAVARLVEVGPLSALHWPVPVLQSAWAAAVVLSSFVLLLLPGLLAVLAWGKAHTVSDWLLTGFTASLIIVSVAAGIVQAVLGAPLRGGTFAAVVGGTAIAAWLAARQRVRRASHLAWPMADRMAAPMLALSVGVPCLLLVALWPKFFWENFNGDGVHAYESARLLLRQPLPFWPEAAGPISAFPGTTSMLFAFPSAWFIRLFGEVEVSARLPFLLYLVALHAAIVALAEHRSGDRLGPRELVLVWLALVIYAVVMAYSATYSPYAADIALPATQDTLFMVCVLAYFLAFARGTRAGIALFLLLTYLSLPSGPLVVALWLAAVVAVWRPVPWRLIAWSVAAIAACVALGVVLPWILSLLGSPAPGREYARGELAKRFAFVQISDWRRLGYVVLPGGILPALSLLAWRRQDALARAITLLTACYFGFFFFPYQTALHYFVPCMILPVLVFWRLHLAADARGRASRLAAAALCGLAALWISLPDSAAPDFSARVMASALEVRSDGYAESRPDAFRRCGLLARLFPYTWDPSVPHASYGGSVLPWNYYGHLPKHGAVNYLLQAASDPPPPDMRRVAEDGDAALYLRSDERWARHLAIRPHAEAGSPVYRIPRSMLFRSVPRAAGDPPMLDVAAVLTGAGVPVKPLLERLGVVR